MSSILRALKKLEQEGFEKQSEKVWPDSFQSLKEKGRRIRFKKIAAFIFCSLLVLFVFSGGLIFYSFRDSARAPQTSIEVKQHKITPNPKKEVKTGQMQFTHLERQVLMDNMRSNINKIPAIEKKPMAEQGFFPTNTQKSTNPETSISDRAETIPVSRERDNKTRVPELKDDPRIDLQAIAWAADEKSSFAVINNRIIREGQPVDGIVVTKIDKDEVYFREGHNEWREKFKIK